MHHPFSLMPNNARVWVFQSNRLLKAHETEALTTPLAHFCDSWTAHSKALTAAFDLREGYFVAIAVNEADSNASGCSIDKLMHLMKQLGDQLNVDFFDRLRVVTKKDGQNVMYKISELAQTIKEEQLKPTDLVYDNLITTVGQYRDQHLKPIYQTWLAKYFGQKVLAEI